MQKPCTLIDKSNSLTRIKLVQEFIYKEILFSSVTTLYVHVACLIAMQLYKIYKLLIHLSKR